MSAEQRQEVLGLSNRILSNARSKIWLTIDVDVAQLDRLIRDLRLRHCPEDHQLMETLLEHNQEIEALSSMAQLGLAKHRGDLRRSHHAVNAYLDVKRTR